MKITKQQVRQPKIFINKFEQKVIETTLTLGGPEMPINWETNIEFFCLCGAACSINIKKLITLTIIKCPLCNNKLTMKEHEEFINNIKLEKVIK